MNRTTVRKLLMGGALLIGLAAAGISASRASSSAVDPVASGAPMLVTPWALAHLLAVAPPDTVVITLDTPSHAMPEAMPAAAYGANDDALVLHAPVARRIVLAGADPVRTDRVARRLMATGHDVRVVDGGIQAWDKLMDTDPMPPSDQASMIDWERYRQQLALRRRFGSKESAPAAPVAAPPPAVGGAGPAAAPKKREGC